MITRRAFLAGLLAAPAALAFASETSRFRSVYLNKKRRKRFYAWSAEQYRLYDPDKLEELMMQLSGGFNSDAEIYGGLLKLLPTIKPPFYEISRLLPAFRRQKQELVVRLADLIGSKPVNGLLEIGTNGKYAADLRRAGKFVGPLYALSDGATPVGVTELADPQGVAEDTGAPPSTGAYDALAVARVQAESLDLAVCTIGLHHCPEGRLEGLLGATKRALRPHGRLILREHDAEDSDALLFCAVAHDLFNAGLDMPWSSNAAEPRAFRSLQDWTRIFADAGFKRTPTKPVRDKSDPTRDCLVEFIKA